MQSGEAVGAPKAGDRDQVEAIRLLRIARRRAMKARTQAANQIHAVIDTAPDELRRRFTGRPTDEIVADTARFHRRLAPTTPLDAARLTLRSLARRWQHLDAERSPSTPSSTSSPPAPRPRCGRSTVSARKSPPPCSPPPATTPNRLRSSASFAALCGVSPLDASSGRQQHHRLNRGGDRQANWALYIIVISRLRWHTPTQAYMARRLAEGAAPR